MRLQDFLEVLQSKTGKAAKKTGKGYTACCPAHDDKNPSLSISVGADGKVLLKCFTGCPAELICSSLNLQVAELFNAPAPSTSRTVYSYKDEQGQEVYRKIRIEPGFNGKAKSFYCERIHEDGEIVKSLKGCRKVLYRLPEIIKATSEGAPIFLVEGEKDADKLIELGLAATTSPESLLWLDSFSEVLSEADIIIIYDMDKTGFERRDLLCKHLHKKTKSLRVVELPGLLYQEAHGADVSDWLIMGHTSQELLKIIAQMPQYSPPREKGKIHAISLGEFLEMSIPEREMLLSPILPSQGLAMLYAKRGVGKTHVALGIACAVAQGGKFLNWSAPKPRKVLYIDGEMPAIAMQERLHRLSLSTPFDLTIKKDLILITPDLQEGPIPDLSTLEGRKSIEEFVDKSDLIIIDNLSSLFRSGFENEADSWQPAQDWALELRRRGKSVLFIHHAGKGGNQRGTSKREDILDTVISLKHPNNYRSDQGARFEVHYEKTRHFAGEEASPFHVQLREDEKTRLWHWEIANVQASPEVTSVADFTKEGHTIKEITEITGLSKSQVETRQKKAREEGLIN